MKLSDYIGVGGATFPEAPINGATYGRKDAGWEPVYSATEANGAFAALSHSHALFSQNTTGFVPAPGVAQGYLKHNGTWEQPTTTGVPEAPSDGNQYARQNTAWTVVNVGGGGITEAPIDGLQYARQNAGWAAVSFTMEDWLRADIADQKTAGNLTFNDNVQMVLGTGNDARFYVDGAHAYIKLESGIGNMYMLDGTSTRYTFERTTGNFIATGNVSAYSDARLKDNITQIPDALDKVKQLSGVTFDRIDTNKRQTGLIAQDVELVLPEAVGHTEDGYLTLAYGNMIGLLVEAIKELAEEVSDLRGRL
jgi:hypothetical protein